jgi:hypothetical protein
MTKKQCPFCADQTNQSCFLDFSQTLDGHTRLTTEVQVSVAVKVLDVLY